MEIKLILCHGLIASLLITLALLPIGLKNPRMMLQDYPKSIRSAVPPKTAKERRQTVWYALPFLLVLIGYPLIAGAYYTSQYHWSFGKVFAFVYGISFFFNVYDLLIIDWLIFCTLTPKPVVIPGTEGNNGYKDYRFHFIGFLKGIFITLIISLPISAVIVLLK